MKEKIYEMAHAKEFVPFSIHLSDGRAVHVSSRDHILVTLNPKTYIVVEDDEGRSEILTTLHISSVEFRQEQNA